MINVPPPHLPFAGTVFIKTKLFVRHSVRRWNAIKTDTASENNLIAPTDELIATLYDELCTIARREHFRAGSPQTIPATALISEAYIKLQKRDGWESKSHFLGCASTAIRHILIDAARARMTAKRGSGDLNFTRSLDSLAASVSDDDDVVRLGDALKQLAEVDANLAQVVDCRFFAGLDEKETAHVLGVSDRTIRRWWTQARAWIHAELMAD
jgi:RNA polymerase sigma factor (TIGR02999 family)